MERAQRLFDCITEIGDSYIQEAEQFRPEKRAVTIDWRRWGSWAAAVVLVLGLGRLAMENLPKMGASASNSTTAAPSASEPASSTPTSGASAEEQAAPSVSGTESTEISAGGENFFGDYQMYDDYGQMAREADIIVETKVIAVTPDVELDISGDADSPAYMTFTVVELEVSDVLKGDAEPGQILRVKNPQSTQIAPVRTGDQNIYFMKDYREHDPDMPFSTLNPSQAVVCVEDGAVLADGSMLGREEELVSMDKEEFKQMLRESLEES